MRELVCGRFRLALSRPLVMGIVNVTPDSFSDGGRFASVENAVSQGRRLIEEGADFLDIGGESTRPGAAPVPLAEELGRVLPVLERLADSPVPLSIDTYKPEVMAAALAAGASMVNDVKALREPGALDVLRASDAAVCLMHMQGEPQTMQVNPRYEDVVDEVRAFLHERVAACEAAGIERARLVVDPGFGFGKSRQHNIELLRHLRELVPSGLPLLAGLSRKSVLGKITARSVDERVHSSVAAALVAVYRGAAIVRVHDVGSTRDAFTVYGAVELNDD
ncbi:MAG TPA: dihydropteroate synthase [Burkholderiales bacterium]|nr:dihydropteroate synthase [Betaproteobacteria bacterium]HQR54281.1 dihydropteroate synthase [Burkholderiales bacterium]